MNRWGQHWHRVFAIVRRDLTIEFSYQLRLLTRALSLVASMAFMYYVSEFVGQPEALADSRGSYFDYVVIGIGLTGFMSLGLSAFIARINQEQNTGTFEILLAGPTPLSLLVFAGFVVPFAITTVELMVMVGFGLGVIGGGISVSAALIALPLAAVTILSFCAFGIAGAALVVLAKRGDLLTVPLYQATLVFSGVLFPVSLFPWFVRPISYLFPSFYGLRGIRDALLLNASFREILDDLLIVTGFCVVLLPASIWLFARSIATAKRLGVLGAY